MAERHAGRHVERVVAARGGRRRGGARRSDRRARDRRGHGARARPIRSLRADLQRRGLERAADVLVGRRGRARCARIYAEMPRGRAGERAGPSPAPAPADAPTWPGCRVALVHDWLTGHARRREGARGALRALSRTPQLFTLVHVPGAVSPADRAHGRSARRSSSACRAPPRWYRHYLPLFPPAIERFDLDDFDLVISTSHCAAKSVVAPGRARHLCYCHSPMRYAWDQFDAYFGPERLGPGAAGSPGRCCAAGPVGRRHERPARPLCGEFSIRCAPDPAIL